MGHDNIIQNPIINERVTKYLGLRGGNAISQVSPELMPVVIVDDLSKTAKSTDTPTARPFMARAALQGANFSSVRLAHLQPSAGYVLRINKLTCCSAAALSQTFMVGLFAGTAAGVAVDPRQKVFVDGRVRGEPQIDVRTLDAGVAPDPLIYQYEDRFQGGAVRTIVFNDPPVLVPNPVGAGRINLMIITLTVAAGFLAVAVEGVEEPLLG